MGKNTILIVDDEEIMRECIIDDVIEDESYEIIEASNGAEGLKMFYEHNPILLILDFKMPVLNGLQLLKIINFKPTDPYDVIVLTAGASMKGEDMVREYSSYFYKKPFDLDEFRELINTKIQTKLIENNRYCDDFK